MVNNVPMTISAPAPIIIYEAAGQAVEVRLDAQHDTVWLTQAQMVMLFGRDQSVISRHIRNAYKEGELERPSTMQKMHSANSDKPVEFYNLGMITSVGYWGNSPPTLALGGKPSICKRA